MKNRLVIPKQGCMKVDVTIFGSAHILKMIEQDALDQLTNGACLPGVVGCVGMPDIHSGYGLPIGGVMVVDADEGVVSPGAVGVDINCGVRAVSVPLSYEKIRPRLESLFDGITQVVGTGVGGKTRSALGRVHGPQFRKLVEQGVPALVELGYATARDVECTEEDGCLAMADLDNVSKAAVERGEGQVGTLGSGNHFLEIQRVLEVYDAKAAAVMGLDLNQVCAMIHCGSRGFGEQICRDHLQTMASAMRKYDIQPPSKNLACVPIKSPEGKAYLSAMACAANFAWVNRQVILHEVRGVFQRVLGIGNLELIYDVAHNIAKFESYGGREVLVHRKGATRAFPAGHPAVPERYRAIGQPAIIPGSMGTASFIVIGTQETLRETWGSVNHGAGRIMSRSAALGHPKKGRPGLVTQEQFKESMRGILYRSGSGENLLDEAPAVYKDSVEVVDALADIGLVRKVVKLMPLAVLKG
ncbi:MAG: RtcB family protein [Chloroflexi bacterium]|nr:RtcB family protein [Chloroflexota bacterium]